MGQPKFTNKQHDGFLESLEKKIYTAKKNMNATLNATYINLFNRLNKIKDKIRSENSRKALVDFSISDDDDKNFLARSVEKF